MARILCFLEDEGLLAEAYRRPLSQDFHQVVAAKWTDDLAGLVRRSRPDLILIDFQGITPENSNRLFGYLHATRAAQNIPVIALADDPAAALCLPSAVFVLQKPIPALMLRDLIHHAVQALLNGPGPGDVTERSQGTQQGPPGGFQGSGEPVCPFFKKVSAKWLYPLAGYCGNRPDGKLMIPSIAEYRQFCTTEDFQSCVNYPGR